MATPVRSDIRQRADRKIEEAGSAGAYKAPGVLAVWLSKLRGKIEYTNEVESIELSNDKVYVNPGYIDGAHPGRVLFDISHNTLHFALGHQMLAEKLGLLNADGSIKPESARDFELLSRACDAVTNEPLIEDKIGRPPENAVRVPADYEGEREALALYYWMKEQEPPPPPPPPQPEPQDDEDEDEEEGGEEEQEGEGEKEGEGEGEKEGQTPGKGKGEGKGEPQEGEGPPGEPQEGNGQGPQGPQGDQPAPGEGCLPRPPPQANQSDQEAESADARETIQRLGIGQGSALAEALKPPPVRADWRKVIGSGVEITLTESSNRTTRTYSRAPRRQALDDGIILPGRAGGDPSLCIMADVSGSMSREMVALLVAHAMKIAGQYPDLRLFFVAHTDRVEWAGWIKPGGDEEQIMKAVERTGGTDCNAAYAAAREVAPRGRFDCMVHFTDCFVPNWPEPVAKRNIIAGMGPASVVADPVDAGATKLPDGWRFVPVQEG